MAERPSQAWIELFLAVADLVDGGWEDHDRAWVEESYRALVNGDGAEIYGEAMADSMSKFVAWVESLSPPMDVE